MENNYKHAFDSMMGILAVDGERLLPPHEDDVRIYLCCMCGEGVCGGDRYLKIDHDHYCQDCVVDELMETAGGEEDE